jgi:hypothetical protein
MRRRSAGKSRSPSPSVVPSRALNIDFSSLMNIASGGRVTGLAHQSVFHRKKQPRHGGRHAARRQLTTAAMAR